MNIYIYIFVALSKSAGCCDFTTALGWNCAGAEVFPDFPELLLELMHSPGTLLVIFNDHAAAAMMLTAIRAIICQMFMWNRLGGKENLTIFCRWNLTILTQKKLIETAIFPWNTTELGDVFVGPPKNLMKADVDVCCLMLFIHLLLRTLSPYLFLCLLLFFPFWLPLFKLECLFSQDFFAQNRLISMPRACRSFEHSAVFFLQFVVGCGSLFWRCYQCDHF